MKLDEASDGAIVCTSLDDLFAQLDASKAAGREANAIRADRGPRIPRTDHAASHDWRPPPSREEVLKNVSADCCRRFNRATRNSGELFDKSIGILRHEKEFNIWEVDRICNATPERSIRNPPGRPGLKRYHQQPEAFQEPQEESLHPQHREWLQGHHVQRERHLYPVYHALQNVEKAEKKANAIQKQRETTRDVMTRSSLQNPVLCQGIKDKLKHARLTVKSTRVFNKLSNIDVICEEQKKHEDALNRARSAPILAFKPPAPETRPSHLRPWTGPDRRKAWTQIDVGLKHTTPGRSQEEERELHNSPRYRARGA